MCNSPGEHAEAFELLTLAQLSFEFLALGNVAGDLGTSDDRAARTADGRDGQGNIDLLAVLPEPDGFEVLDASTEADLLNEAGFLVGVFRIEQDADGLTDGLPLGVPEDLPGAEIPASDDAVEAVR